MVLTLEDGTDEAVACDLVYDGRLREAENERMRAFEERERKANARREMLDRARKLDEESRGGGHGDDDDKDGGGGGSGRKKGRKKRRKR